MSTKSYINIVNKYDRIIVLVDMDCFYCQVEEKLNPELIGKPIAVVQYNAWKGGGIIAVNYPARAKGVTRHMRGDEAKEHCPEIELVRVPSVREKADLTKYRNAGKEVAEVLQNFTTMLERASVDEAYLDITERVVEKIKLMNEGKYRVEPEKLVNTYATGYTNIGEFVQNLSNTVDKQELPGLDEEDPVVYKKSDIKLLIGAAIVNEIRAAVKEKTGYDCSAGIAHNKILAKFACGMNKPNKQTILPLKKIPELLATLPLNKVKGLGGKFGEQVVEKLKIKFVADLLPFSEKELQRNFEERMGSWLYWISRGIDLEAVTSRFMPKSIGCCKKFPGRNAITGLATLTHWLGELANEITERLTKDELENNRKARQMTVSFTQTLGSEDVASTRSVQLATFEADGIAKDALEVVKKNTDQFLKGDTGVLNNPIKFLGISVGKFENVNNSETKNSIKELFSVQAKKNEAKIETAQPTSCTVEQIVPEKKNSGIMGYLKQKTSPTPMSRDTEQPESKSFFSKFLKKPETEEQKEMVSDAELDAMEQQLIDNVENENQNDGNELISDNVEIVNTSQVGEAKCGLLRAKTVEKINEEVVDQNKSKNESFFSDLINRKKESSFESHDPVPDSENSEKPSTSTTVLENYTETYAEFYRPPIISEISEICPRCSRKVPEFEFQSHLDYHFALDLSQEQRLEFRNEIKKKIITSPPPNKRQKLIPNGSTTGSVTTANKPIDTFLIKKTQDVQASQTSSEVRGAVEKCSECNKLIEIEKILEHLDYHAAKRLQIELNGITPTATVRPNKTSQQKVAIKKGLKMPSVLKFFESVNEK